MSLAETQRALRNVVVAGRAAGTAPRLGAALIGGADPKRRLELHRRTYRSSLVSALLGKFPASAWLVGERTLMATASEFVQMRPPRTPCIAEYGETFPAFLAWRVGSRAPYVLDFARLEWLVGHASVAVEKEATPVDALAEVPEEELEDVRFMWQPGVHYLSAGWPVDSLLEHFLADSAPERLEMAHGTVHIEVRGSRGDLRMQRHSAEVYAFRQALAGGAMLSDAIAIGRTAHPRLDPAREIAALFSEGLVTGIDTPTGAGRSGAGIPIFAGSLA